MRYAQLVIGPAGSGKSTYCSAMVQYGIDTKRTIDVINLDPAAEYFNYQPIADIRELIQLDDTMLDDELNFGPNGGLIYCLEYLLENNDWLSNKLNNSNNNDNDDYILIDCPGQIELYTHLTCIKKLIKLFENWNFHICCILLIDVQFMIDGAKFLSGTMAALSMMINLELPHINLLTKMDLLNRKARKRLEKFLEPDIHFILGDIEMNDQHKFNQKYWKLSQAIGELIENYSLIRFLPLNLKDQQNVQDIMITIDNVLQYGEDQDVRVKDFEEPDNDDC